MMVAFKYVKRWYEQQRIKED